MSAHRVEDGKFYRGFRLPSWKTSLTVAAICGTAFGIYLGLLYRQLDRAFLQTDQFIPTKIYSDVSRISPPLPKKKVLNRLNALAYHFKEEGEFVRFTLRQLDYPDYLLPENHPLLNVNGDSQITLRFDGNRSDSTLLSVNLNGQDVPDIYVEPEIVATLSKGPKEIRELVTFENIPSLVWKAIIAVEDQHFLEHKGLDPRGIARALWVDLRTRSLAQGGSTITLQLVKNLMARRGKNIFKKVNEIFLALLLEARFDKEQILSRYLNEVYLGQIGNLEIRGVSEGAKYFFGRTLDDLNLAEIALMAGVIRGTGYYNPYLHRLRAFERMRLVLRKMVETGMIAEAEARAALLMPVRLAPPVTVLNKAPYFTDFVKAELYRQLKDHLSEDEINTAGFKVYTTLDAELNRIAQTAVADGISALEKQLKIDSKAHPEDRLEGALASVDQSTGSIRALVGGRNYSQSNFNRILNMKRQVGSTFKPIVYLTAFLKGEDSQGIPYSPAHPAEDSPWTIKYDNGRQTWSPKNYEKEYEGWINYRTALAQSINTVTAKLGMELGIASIVDTAKKLGISSNLPEVPSLSLGVAELSPVELLQAYAAIANHGAQDELTAIRAITHDDLKMYARFVFHPKQVIPPGPTDLLASMLQSVVLDGTAKDSKRLGLDRFAAGKTGTTSNYRDAWFAGFTPQLTTVVWVGSDQTPNLDEKDSKRRSSRVKLTGAGSALPIWVSFVKKGLEGTPNSPFAVSTYLEEMAIDRKTGLQVRPDCPASQIILDKFLRDHPPHRMTCESR